MVKDLIVIKCDASYEIRMCVDGKIYPYPLGVGGYGNTYKEVSADLEHKVQTLLERAFRAGREFQCVQIANAISFKRD